MYLFFDTETNGLPKKPLSNKDNWPRITQIAWQLCTIDNTIVEEYCFLIKPDGWQIPDEEFFRKNNMSTERCYKEGVKLNIVMEKFIQHVNQCDYLISHNIIFDYNVVQCEMLRLSLKFNAEPKKICTMRQSTKYCRLEPYRYGQYKWPTLSELHKKLFNVDFKDAHNALSDVNALRRCFFKLNEMGLIAFMRS